MSEERLKSYSHSTHSSNLLRTKSGNGIDTLPENHRRYLSQKSLHVHSHIVPTAKLQNSKSAEETNPWNENNRKLKEGLSGYSNKVDGRSKFQGVGIEKADETNKKSTEQEVEDNEQDEVKN
uniref:Uncharacterized protein n=1 Tax=Meloidogyne incognita TaxID=6306 RepID=A0A914L142_MELIC